MPERALTRSMPSRMTSWKTSKRSSRPAAMPLYCDRRPGTGTPPAAASSAPRTWRPGCGRSLRSASTAVAASVAATTRRWPMGPAPGRQRVGDVGEVRVGMGFEEVGEAGGGVVERPGVAARQREHLLADRRRRLGAWAGASCTMTWAFVPPTPSELMPARRGRSPGHGGGSSESTNGDALEVEQRARRGVVGERRQRAVRSACTTLIRLATPAAVSRWPMFGFVDTMRQKPVSARRRPERLGQRGDLDRVADGGAGAVGLEQLRCRAPRARRRRAPP